MPGYVHLVDKLGKAVGQVGRLYALCTRLAYTSWLFVRRPSTGTSVLGTVFARRFWQNNPVKFSCAHFTQGLLMQINKEGY